MDENIIIDVNDVTVRFNMASEGLDNLKEYIIKLLKHELLFQEFFALKNVSFQVKRGEAWGFIGTNGAGKSTLLKLISRILNPYRGSVTVNGRIAPLIELGAGLDMNLTARENIYLDGCLLGHSKKFMEEHFDEIVDFAELWDFLDIPIKNFSSGMQARLGFAIATIVQPDILIVDEILSVGDIAFQQKCQNRMKEMLANGTTLLFVSHSIDDIRRLCDHALWLKKGEVVMSGEVTEVCDAYISSQIALPHAGHKFESPLVTSQKYLMMTYNSHIMKLLIYRSDDGLTFETVGDINYNLKNGNRTLRDPSFIKVGDYYYITYTAVDWKSGSVIGMCRTKNFGIYEELPNIPIGNFARIWSPAFYVEDDAIYIIINACFGMEETDHFSSYLVRYNPDANSVGEPVRISGLPDSVIDSRIYRIDGRYYLIYKNEELKYIEMASSDQLYGPYTVEREGDWNGWGTHLGGPDLIRTPEGRYRLYMEDNDICRLYYAESDHILDGWSDKIELASYEWSHPEVKAISEAQKDVSWDYLEINQSI